jgi:putative ABC transport system permease protein
VFLALREMRRAKVRFGLLTGAVALLVLLILFLQALLTGLIDQFIGAIEHQSGQVLVYNDQARKNLEGSRVTAEQAEAIAAAAEVAAPGAVSGPLGEGTFTVLAGDEEQDAVIFGYELGGPGEPTTLVDGRLPEGRDEAVASSRNAGDGFDIGDVVEVVPAGGADPVRFTVVGLAEEINYSVAPTMFTDFASFEEARFAVNPDATGVLPSAVAITLPDGTDANEVVRAIAAAVDGVEPLTRQEAVDGSPGVAAVTQSFAVILLLFYLVVPLVTGLFFLIVTFQKAGALTLLRAVGIPSGRLVRALLLQVAVVVLGGAIVATAIFSLIASGSGGSRSLSISVDASTVGATVGGIMALALLTSLVSARRVLRIDPIEATTAAGVHL